MAEISWSDFPSCDDALATWRVVALATPTVTRACASCGARRPFRSSERFRVNAQQRRVDVWLVYRCTRCDATWNLSVATRRTPDELGPDLVRFERNDAALARACALDRSLLARGGARPDADVAFRVDVVPARAPHASGIAWARVALGEPVEVRLERVAAEALRASRTRVRSWAGANRLALHPADGGALHRAARDGQRLALRIERAPEEPR